VCSSDLNEAGGLVLHTKRVCKAAEILIDAWMTPIDPDVIRSACILHDTHKYGSGPSATQHTQHTHPQLASEFVKKVADGKYEKAERISNAILCHMGKWGPRFETRFENLIVHLADIVATQMYVDRR
jgi:HD superfamily phosphodiesterase